MMLRVGLTGGIGAGKSTVARMLVSRGAVLVDADVLAREVVEPGTPGLASVVAEFGARVLAAGGSLDRAALADIVFADGAARDRLNGIVHPLVRAASARRIEQTRASDPHAIVVEDIPLLYETGVAHRLDYVIVVEADPKLRLDRLERRGLAPDAARARIAAQASDTDRATIADVVLRNDGDLETLEAAVDRVWREELRPRA